MIPKIVELKITEDELSGVEAIAFVEEPAIELDFQFFNKQSFETYNDYPKKAVENAKRGIELNKENNNKCATQVGKVRAQQLANGENLSLDTIRRMRSFLIRQKDNYELALKRKDYTACGYISYLLWGGVEALPWAEKKLRQAGEELSNEDFIEPNPCQEGYIAYGTKIKDGREVPNCVPKTNLSKVEQQILEGLAFEKSLFEKIGEYEGMPYYETPEEARAQSPKYGCSEDSYHEHTIGDKTYYMPCGQHSDLFSVDVSGLPNYVDEVSEDDEYNDWINDLTDDIEDAVYNALINVGRTEDDLIDEGYDFDNAIVVDEKDSHIAHAFVASVSEIKSEGTIRPVANKPSNEDYGQWAVLYRYMRYTGKPEVGNNSRKFCQNVIQANRYYRKEDINQLTLKGANEGFGLNGQKFYDIFRFKGGKNCQHFWQEVLVPRFKEDKDRKRPSAVVNRITEASSLNPDTLTNLYADGRLTFSQEQMDEKQLVATPIMIPNKLIPRVDEDGEKYFVFFSEQTIKDIAYKFAQAKLADSINHEHDMNSMVDDIYLAESWIVEEPQNDKSNTYGYKLPKGSWFGLFKIDNEEYWNDYIKNGKVKGVSVEGYFVNKLSALQ